MSSESLSAKAAAVVKSDTVEFVLSADERAEIEKLERQRQAQIAMVTPNVSVAAQDSARGEFERAAATLAAEKLGVDVDTASKAMSMASETVGRLTQGNGPTIFDQAAHQQRSNAAAQQAPRVPYTAAAARLSELWSAANVSFIEQIAYISSALNEHHFWGTKIKPFPLPEALAKDVADETDAAFRRHQKPVYSDALLERVRQHQVESRAALVNARGTGAATEQHLREVVEKQQVIYHLIFKLSMFEVLLLRWASGEEPSVDALAVVGRYASKVLLPALRAFKSRIGADWKVPPTRDHVALDEIAPWLPDFMAYEALISLVEEELVPLSEL